MIKLAVIGAGWVAREHLKVLNAIEGVKVVGIFSRTREKAEALAKDFHIEACFDSFDALMKESKPDALLVCVSANQMFEMGLQALDKGVPVFFEKPAGLAPEENLQLLLKAKEKNIRTMVGFNRRYYSVFHQGIDIIKQHGQLRGVVVQGHERFWRVRESAQASPVILDKWIYANSTHTIDLLRFFAGEPTEIQTLRDSVHEVNGDQFVANFKMSSGALGQYQSFWYSPGGWSVTLYGDGVTVEFKPLEKGQWMGKDFKPHDIPVDDKDIQFKPGFYRQMEAFIRLVKGVESKESVMDLESAYQTMLIAQRLIQGKS